MTNTQTSKDRIIIFDTTLRDGEQSPGCSMNLEEKLRMAKILDEMGVDVIEAGFPVASPGDFEAVNEIVEIAATAIYTDIKNDVSGIIFRIRYYLDTIFPFLMNRNLIIIDRHRRILVQHYPLSIDSLDLAGGSLFVVDEPAETDLMSRRSVFLSLCL